MKKCNSITTCPERKFLVFAKNGYDIQECATCEHQYVSIGDPHKHIARTYSDQYFFGRDQAGYPDYLKDERILTRTGNWYGKLLSKYAGPGELLDVGSAAGFILKGLIQSEWVGHGVEPNDTMAHYGRQNLGLDICTGDFESFSTTHKYDVVTLIQVIAHFHDLDKALKNLQRVLKKDGLVLVESWRRDSIIARFRKSSWHEYSPPSVIHWFTDRTLIDLFRFYGFTFVASGYPPKRISVNHALAILLRRPSGISTWVGRSIGDWSLPYPPVDLKWFMFRN